MIVVNDVTQADDLSYSVSQSKSQSSITPFHKVLQGEVKARTQSADTADSAAAVSTTAKTTQTDTVKSTENDTDSGVTDSGKVKLSAIFKRAAKKYNISYDFLTAVAKAESDFNPKCVSSAGAKGIMQLMPYECKEFGVTDPYDPEQNIMASAKLLAAHLKKFNGDFTLAAAAYNAGSGAVKKYGGVPPYSETQNYVKKINKYMKEGVSVPDKSYSVKDTGKYTQNQIESTAATTDQSSDPLKNAAAATEKDLDELRVTVGTGDDMTTMTYGAYLRYLELGSLGVG